MSWVCKLCTLNNVDPYICAACSYVNEAYYTKPRNKNHKESINESIAKTVTVEPEPPSLVSVVISVANKNTKMYKNKIATLQRDYMNTINYNERIIDEKCIEISRIEEELNRTKQLQISTKNSHMITLVLIIIFNILIFKLLF